MCRFDALAHLSYFDNASWIIEIVDMAMNSGQLRGLIRETLQEVDLYSKSAEELLMLTAAVESNLGEYIEQTKGPALGIFQMEPLTHNDIMDRWLSQAPKAIREKVEKFLAKYVGDIERHEDELTLQYNLKYAILLARLKYYTVKAPLPPHHDKHALASYYKKYYNTPLGKGTVSKALEKYNKYVEDA